MQTITRNDVKVFLTRRRACETAQEWFEKCDWISMRAAWHFCAPDWQRWIASELGLGVETPEIAQNLQAFVTPYTRIIGSSAVCTKDSCYYCALDNALASGKRYSDIFTWEIVGPKLRLAIEASLQ